MRVAQQTKAHALLMNVTNGVYSTIDHLCELKKHVMQPWPPFFSNLDRGTAYVSSCYKGPL